MQSRNPKEVDVINGNTDSALKCRMLDAINGNGDASVTGQGLAIGGQERLSREYGYLSELTAAVFVCRVMEPYF
jgi:ABC-type cobalamin transport system ATPase subunit